MQYITRVSSRPARTIPHFTVIDLLSRQLLWGLGPVSKLITLFRIIDLNIFPCHFGTCFVKDKVSSFSQRYDMQTLIVLISSRCSSSHRCKLYVCLNWAQRTHDVALTSMRRHHVAWTSVRRHPDAMRPLGGASINIQA